MFVSVSVCVCVRARASQAICAVKSACVYILSLLTYTVRKET